VADGKHRCETCITPIKRCVPFSSPKEAKGGIVAVLADDGFSLRDLKPGPKGQAPVASRRSRFTAGRIAPATRPGTYDVFVSVGERDGTPAFALPLKDDDRQRRYRLGTITLQP